MIAQQASIAFSGNIPANYDAYLGPLFLEPFAMAVANQIGKRQPKTVLEVACGTGRVTRHLPATLASGGMIIATDVNPAMLNYARETLAKFDNINYDVVDAVELPYPAAAFDCVLSQFGVMFYSDRPKAYAEAFRTLRPGGTFFFTAWDKLEPNPAARLADETLRQFFPTNTPAFYQVPFAYHDEQRMRDDLASAGFENIRIETLSLTGHADTAEVAARGLLEGTPAHTAIIERDEAMLPVMEKFLASELAGQFGQVNLRVPIQARLVVAVKG